MTHTPQGGGTDLEKRYEDVRPWKPPFHTATVVPKGPISSKRVSSQDSLLRKFGNFILYSLNFHPNFSSQAPKFENFQLTSPQIWKFSVHKPPNLEIFSSQAPLFRGTCQFASHTLQISRPHTPTWKKVECPPQRTLNHVAPEILCWWGSTKWSLLKKIEIVAIDFFYFLFLLETLPHPGHGHDFAFWIKVIARPSEIRQHAQ